MKKMAAYYLQVFHMAQRKKYGGYVRKDMNGRRKLIVETLDKTAPVAAKKKQVLKC